MIEINGFSERNAVYIIDSDGKTLVEHNITKLFRSASVIKIFILAYYLEKHIPPECVISIAPSDRINYSDITELSLGCADIGTLLTLMIGSSDNTATNLLIKHSGMPALNGYISSRFGGGTHVGRIMLDFDAAKQGYDNLTCLSDVKKCLDVCLSYDIGRRILATQKCRDRLMRYIYTDIPFYGKAGEIPEVFNDVGYIGNSFAGVLTDGMDFRDAAILCGKAGLVALHADKPLI